MKFAVLDFETYYAQDYTLKSMTTEAYVRDPRFKTHCVGIKTMDNIPGVGENPVIQTEVMDGPTFAQVASLTNDYAVVMHKASFDGLILSHHYGVQPAFFFDTLSMARLIFPHDKSHSLEALAAKFGLPSKTVPYNLFRGVRDLPQDVYAQLSAGCAHDVELTYIIFRHLLPLVPRSELRVIDMTIRMFTQPVLRLDYPRMEAYLAKVREEKNTILTQLGVTKSDLQSSAKFAEILTNLGVEPPTKPSPKGEGKRIYAFAKTDEEMKELCDDEDDRVSALCNARLGQKSTLNETRCERLLRMCERGSLTVPLRYYGAGASGRFSGEDKVNFQNFPRSGEIRECLMAPPGYVLLVGDLSQIECIAEGQKILTRSGTKAIQDVQLDDEVWDGQEFCAHGGVVYKGIQAVVSYQGITATPEHIVFVGSHSHAQGMPLQVAGALQIHISDAYTPNAVRETQVPIVAMPWIQDIRCKRNKIQFLVRGKICTLGMGELTPRNIQWCRNRQDQQRRALRAGKLKIVYAQGKRKSSAHYFLGAHGRWKRISYARFFEKIHELSLWERSDKTVGFKGIERRGDNFTFKKQIPNDVAQSPAQAWTSHWQPALARRAKVYDIVNCGPRNRFWCQGVIASNCRMLNGLAGEEWVLQAFREGRDLYSELATTFYQRQITKADKAERGMGKQVELSCGFGSGGPKIALTARRGTYGPPVYITDEEGTAWRDHYRRTHPKICGKGGLWERGEHILAALFNGTQVEWGPMIVRDKRVFGPTGAWLDYSNLIYKGQGKGGKPDFAVLRRQGESRIYKSKFIQNIIEFLSRLILTEAMVEMAKTYKAIMCTHDEGVFLVPVDQAEAAKAYLHKLLTTPPAWCPGIPLEAEVGYDVRYTK